MVAILDAFHFDLSGAKPLEERNEPSQLSPNPTNERVQSEGVSAPTEHSPEEMRDGMKKSEERKDEEGEGEIFLMEGEEGEEREELDVEKKVDSESADSTVKQNLAQKIHKTIVHSVLPKLQGVLTKRVRRCTL